MYLVGIDENGFGPALGPLNVSASLFKVEKYENDFWKKLNDIFSKNKDKNKLRLTDSKELARKEWERIALIFYFLLFKEIPLYSSLFLKEFTLKQGFLVKDCGKEEKNMCWQPDFSFPLWEEKTFLKEIPLLGKGVKEALKREKIKVLDIKTLVCCPHNFNHLLKTYNKIELDLYLFETLIEYYHQKYQDEIFFVCGKVGGIKYYQRYFKLLNKYDCIDFKEEDKLSQYHFKDLGKVYFIQNGDSKYLPISLSSIIGKYIREIFIMRINTYFSSRIPGLPYVSGYQDKLTKKFIKKVEGKLPELNISPSCFRRKK